MLPANEHPKRIIHRRLAIAPALSLLLFILALLLWVDSFSRYYGAAYLPDHPRSFELYAVHGAIALSVVDSLLQNDTPPGATRLRVSVVDLQAGDFDYYAGLGFALADWVTYGFTRFTTRLQ